MLCLFQIIKYDYIHKKTPAWTKQEWRMINGASRQKFKYIHKPQLNDFSRSKIEKFQNWKKLIVKSNDLNEIFFSTHPLLTAWHCKTKSFKNNKLNIQPRKCGDWYCHIGY